MEAFVFPGTYNEEENIMRNLVTAATIVVAMSLIGCGDKEEDTAEDTAVEETGDDAAAEETE